MFKVLIVGGKDVEDSRFFEAKCVKYLRQKASEGITIYSTGDSNVENFAKKFRIDVRVFSTNWNKHGKSALKIRNAEMLKDCNALIAFNKGLKDIDIIIDSAKNKQIPIRVVKLNEW
jgi:hypothetical protein